MLTLPIASKRNIIEFRLVNIIKNYENIKEIMKQVAAFGDKGYTTSKDYCYERKESTRRKGDEKKQLHICLQNKRRRL